MTTALIMEGGAMRGMFTAGVTDVMMREGITYDMAVGVSAGAAFGCNYKSGQPGRALRYNKRFAKDPRYCSIRSLIKTGDLYGADFCYHELPETLDPFDVAAYRANPMAFYVVATDAKTGRPVYHRCDLGDGEDLEWFRASASMPLVSRPVLIDDMALLDGGIADPIPLKWAEAQGTTRNVVILTQPAAYRKDRQSGLGGFDALLKDYPVVARAMRFRHILYNALVRDVVRKEREGKVFVIRPKDVLPIGRVSHDPRKLQTVYDLGVAEMEENLSALKAFLAKDADRLAV